MGQFSFKSLAQTLSYQNMFQKPKIPQLSKNLVISIFLTTLVENGKKMYRSLLCTWEHFFGSTFTKIPLHSYFIGTIIFTISAFDKSIYPLSHYRIEFPIRSIRFIITVKTSTSLVGAWSPFITRNTKNRQFHVDALGLEHINLRYHANGKSL